jgi:hypothetical protein
VKIEIHLQGPLTVAWLKNALDGYAAAAEADREEADRRFKESYQAVATQAFAEAETAPAEPEKPKRTRKAKADEATSAGPQEEPAAQITNSPEDRKPVEEIEEAEVVTETVDVFEEAPAAKVYTRDDVKEAMQRYVAKHGMDTLAKNAETLLGAPKLSAIPDDPAAFKAAVERLEAAINV